MKTKSSILGFALLLVLDVAASYQVRPAGHQSKQPSVPTSATRRAFLTTTTAAIAASTLPQPALSADIKVTPIAHTFITASGAAKPIRENDATRLFTNARVVYLFEGKGADSGFASEVLDLTVKRKAGEGPGVTPGSVQVSKSAAPDAVAAAAKNMPEGDVLLVGPIPSGGTAADGKVLADTAKALGTFVGGKTGGGVISVLLDGPREGLKLEEGGYPTSELLWYSLPKKS
jgi:hypothetical protein